MGIVKVNDTNGAFVGFATIKSTDVCGACGASFTAHGPLAWVNANNGKHTNCNLKG